MLMRIVPTLMVRIIAHVRKDTLEMDTHVKVNKSGLHYLKHAALHINYRPWVLARILEVCFHAPLSYFHWVTSFASLMLLDIDECSNGSHDCDVNSICTNANGSHSCTCREGYTGIGESCQGKIGLDSEKKQNNCSLKIMVLLSHKMARIFFSLHLPFANLLCSQILMNATTMFVILMLTVPTLMVLIIASARKDTL